MVSFPLPSLCVRVVAYKKTWSLREDGAQNHEGYMGSWKEGIQGHWDKAGAMVEEEDDATFESSNAEP